MSGEKKYIYRLTGWYTDPAMAIERLELVRQTAKTVTVVEPLRKFVPGTKGCERRYTLDFGDHSFHATWEEARQAKLAKLQASREGLEHRLRCTQEAIKTWEKAKAP